MSKESAGNNVWVSIGLTKNLGNYESLRVDAGARRELVDGEDRDTIWAALWSEVEDQLAAQISDVESSINGKK